MSASMTLIVEEQVGKCWRLSNDYSFSGDWSYLRAILGGASNSPTAMSYDEWKEAEYPQMFKPIMEPRGLPADYRGYADTSGAPITCPKFESDIFEDHYFITWYTNSELEAFDWSKIAGKESSVVGPLGYCQWKYTGKLDYACGVGRGNLISHEEMEGRLITQNFDDGLGGRPGYFTIVEWEVSYAEAAGEFLSFLRSLPFDKEFRIILGFM